MQRVGSRCFRMVPEECEKGTRIVSGWHQPWTRLHRESLASERTHFNSILLFKQLKTFKTDKNLEGVLTLSEKAFKQLKELDSFEFRNDRGECVTISRSSSAKNRFSYSVAVENRRESLSCEDLWAYELSNRTNLSWDELVARYEKRIPLKNDEEMEGNQQT